jgi:DnaJ-class molecular chaperone
MDIFKILELSPNSSFEDAQKNYKKLCLQYHPDKSPTTADKFIEITNAFEYLKKNPSILSQDNKVKNGFIYTSIDVTLEEAYFFKEKTISIERHVLCKECRGTGSKEFERGVCSLCEGKGKIVSNILFMLKKDPKCPKCKGTGILPDKVCKSCNGKRIKIENKIIKIKLTDSLIKSKLLVLREEGNENKYKNFDDIKIHINILPDPNYYLSGNIFCSQIKVLPAQRIIEDVCDLNIFGMTLKYRVPRYIDETRLTGIVDGKKRHIMLFFNTIQPETTDETRKLYRKILDIEKNMGGT